MEGTEILEYVATYRVLRDGVLVESGDLVVECNAAGYTTQIVLSGRPGQEPFVFRPQGEPYVFDCALAELILLHYTGCAFEIVSMVRVLDGENFERVLLQEEFKACQDTGDCSYYCETISGVEMRSLVSGKILTWEGDYLKQLACCSTCRFGELPIYGGGCDRFGFACYHGLDREILKDQRDFAQFFAESRVGPLPWNHHCHRFESVYRLSGGAKANEAEGE